MELDRAIEVVGEDGLESGKGTWEEYLAGIQLGREALKRTREYRTYEILDAQDLLPGESK